MNSTDERLLRYFENEMSGQERKGNSKLYCRQILTFSGSLMNSGRVSSSFSVYKNVEADERYFSSLIPRFNEKR